jgi:hypothetical protein
MTAHWMGLRPLGAKAAAACPRQDANLGGEAGGGGVFGKS